MYYQKIILLVILIIFIIYYGLYYFNDYSNVVNGEPWIIATTKNTYGNPEIIKGNIIRRSDDSKYGQEFTYAFWIYVKNWPSKSTDPGGTDGSTYTHIFNVGSEPYTSTDGSVNINMDYNPMIQAPGVWLVEGINQLYINMNTNSGNENISIGNFPINKWVHVTISLINNNIDVYINGKFKTRKQLSSMPRLNYGNLYLNYPSSGHHGFNGYLSRMRYFNYALSYWRIEQIVKDGPSQAPCPTTGDLPPKLSRDWYMDNNN